MKVWELMAKLSECQAGATVNVGINATLDSEADCLEVNDDRVSIRASADVEVGMTNGDIEWLSTLADNGE